MTVPKARLLLVLVAALLGVGSWGLIWYAGNATGRSIAVVGALIQVVAALGTIRGTWPTNFAIAGLGLVTVLIPSTAFIVSSGITFAPSALTWMAVWVWIWRRDGHSTADESAWPGLVVVVAGFGLGLILLNNL